MKLNGTLCRVIAGLTAVVLLGATQVWAAELSREELRREAFVRGGQAIAAALNAKAEVEPFVLEAVGENVPPSPPRTPAPQSSGTGMSKWVWAGLIAGFAASGALIYHYATGPGASVRNCSTCK